MASAEIQDSPKEQDLPNDQGQPREGDHYAAIEQGILAGSPSPDHTEALEKIVESGKQLVYDEATRDQIWKGMAEADLEDDPRKVAMGVAGLLTMIQREATDIPVELMIPAGALLVVEVLRFMAEAEMLTPDPAFTGNVVEELVAALMQKMGMGEGKAEQPPQQQPNEIPGGVSPSARQGGIIASRQGAPA